MEIGKRIKSRREELGLTSSFVAKQIKVPASTYSEWEGGRGITGEKYYEPLCRVLQMDLYELILGKKANPALLKSVELIDEQIRIIRTLLSFGG